MEAAPMWTDMVMAGAACATVLLTAVIAYMAIRAWRTAKKTLNAAELSAQQTRATVEQMREDSQAQREDSARASRPYLHTQIVPGLAGENCWDLVIENTGRSAAYEMTMTIDTATGNDDQVTEAAQCLASSELSIPPRARIRSFWYIEKDKTQPAQGYPEATVTLTYLDATETRFTDPPVTLKPEKLGLTPVPSEGPTAVSGSDKQARNITHALRAIARHLGELHR